MAIEIKAPAFPESVADGEVAAWHKQEGEAVSRDELIVDIETDKVVLEVVAPANGSLTEIIKAENLIAMVFAVEFFVRWYSSFRWKGIIQYLTKPLVIIDFAFRCH